MSVQILPIHRCLQYYSTSIVRTLQRENQHKHRVTKNNANRAFLGEVVESKATPKNLAMFIII
jgi:hypothetical protein